MEVKSYLNHSILTEDARITVRDGELFERYNRILDRLYHSNG